MTSLLLPTLNPCGNFKEISTKHSSSQRHKLPKVPKQVFSSNKNNKNISEKELKNSLTKYLNTYHALFENIESLRSKDKLNKSELQKLNT